MAEDIDILYERYCPKHLWTTMWAYQPTPTIVLPDGFRDLVDRIERTAWGTYKITFTRTGHVMRDVKISNIDIPDARFIPLICNDGRAEVKINMTLDGDISPNFFPGYEERDLMYKKMKSAEARLAEAEFGSMTAPRSPKAHQEMLKLAEAAGDLRKAATYGSRYRRRQRTAYPQTLFPPRPITPEPEYETPEYDTEEYDTKEYDDVGD